MSIYEEMVREFCEKYGHHIAERPAFPSREIVELRKRLIMEEAQEFCDACDAGDLVKAADGLADLNYVTVGAALALGVPLEDCSREVHRSNLTKSTEKIGGKTVKGPAFEEPELVPILMSAGWAGED